MRCRGIISIRKNILSFAILLLSGILLSLAGEKNKERGKQPESDAVIRAEVEMVSLPVVVTTKDGRRVTDLKKEDFHVFEDNIEQTIAGFAATDEPVSEVLALDTSGSTELELARIQNASIEFVNILHPDDSVAIMSFADDVNLQGDFTIDRDRNAYAIKKTRSGGYTALYEAVWLALEEVIKPVKERKALILFTDGVDTYSRKASEGKLSSLPGRRQRLSTAFIMIPKETSTPGLHGQRSAESFFQELIPPFWVPHTPGVWEDPHQ